MKDVITMMLRTIDFGCIRIIPISCISRYDTYIKSDCIGEWLYYQLADTGEIVAIKNDD